MAEDLERVAAEHDASVYDLMQRVKDAGVRDLNELVDEVVVPHDDMAHLYEELMSRFWAGVPQSSRMDIMRNVSEMLFEACRPDSTPHDAQSD
jgi:hypothetical protein